MASLLGQGARRMRGSLLQRTQAAVTSPAVAEERRRLLPRRMYSAQEQANAELTRKIQQKKEELYDVICKAEQSFWTSSFRNKRLLQHLSIQVKPRPEDFKWQLMCFSERPINVVEAAGLVSLIYLVVSAVLLFKRFLGDIGDRKVVRAMMMEEMREAREAKTRSGLIEK